MSTGSSLVLMLRCLLFGIGSGVHEMALLRGTPWSLLLQAPLLAIALDAPGLLQLNVQCVQDFL